MAAAWRNTATTAQIAAGTTTATGPTVTGLVAGDVMLTTVSFAVTADSINVPTDTPAGWTLLHGPTDTTGTGTQHRAYLFWRTAGNVTGSDTPTWTKTGTSGTWRVGCDAFSGADGVNTSAANPITTAADGLPVVPSVTPGEDGCLIVGICSNRNGFNPTKPTDWTERADSQGVSPSRAVWTMDALATTSPTGTATGSVSPSTKWICYAIAIESTAVAPAFVPQVIML